MGAVDHDRGLLANVLKSALCGCDTGGVIVWTLLAAAQHNMGMGVAPGVDDADFACRTDSEKAMGTDGGLQGINRDIQRAIGAVLGYGLGLSVGGSAVLATLAASASYIAVPAAMRISVPQAKPTLSLAASLGVTFPFNVVFGIPIYLYYAERAHAWFGGQG
mgnify:CR=1 FL=1